MRQSSLLDFFHMTSLNGWNFFPYRNFKLFDCIIWSVAILTSMTFCGLFITQQIQGIMISIHDSNFFAKLKNMKDIFSLSLWLYSILGLLIWALISENQCLFQTLIKFQVLQSLIFFQVTTLKKSWVYTINLKIFRYQT